MSIILKAENISKQYRLGQVGSGTLSHDLNRWWHAVRGKEDPYLKIGAVNNRSAKATEDYVWALRDINFEVKTGEVLGIIGKNGAGKTTLLKLLSRVTAPTTGSIKTRGRIASLLEVGTGFHPELTGRENIFMNGAVLGMTKSEIKRKLEEIIDFSGCEMYIDTPVKRYSSGMTVRLGFAVAAHLEPEILVVDEVLAVGDADFQKKAIGKMQDLSHGQGRTVLFVSHNMASVQSLCDRAIVLENGSTKFEGETDVAINYYLNNDKVDLTQKLIDRKDREGNGKIFFCDYKIEDENRNQIFNLISGQTVFFKFKCEVKAPKLNNVAIAFTISKNNGSLLSTFMSEVVNSSFQLNEYDEVTFVCEISDFPFVEGNYICNISVKEEGQMADWIKNAFSINVVNGDFYGTGRIIPNTHKGVLINQNWFMEKNLVK